MRLTIVLFLATLAAAPIGGASAAEGQQYMVEMSLWIDGELRGNPILVATPGEPAAVEVEPSSGEDAWRIELVLEAPMASEGAPFGAIWLDLTVAERQGDEWEALADSLIGVPEGRTGTVAVVAPGTEPATPENSLVYLTAQTSLLRPGARGD